MAKTPEVIVLPRSVRIKDLDTKSTDWTLFHNAWDKMYYLYAGGSEMEAVADQFLRKRAKELPDIYQARVERFSYQDHVGTATDWYLAALFEKPPRVELVFEPQPLPDTPIPKPGDPPAPPPPPITAPQLPADQQEFYDSFQKNCNRAGMSLVEHLRIHFKHLLLYGRAASLVDLPKKGTYLNAKEEKDAGALNPYFVNWDPRQIVNFNKDSDGNLEWIMFSTRKNSQVPFQAPVTTDCWYYFDKTQFAVYEREVPADERQTPSDAEAELVDSGDHALTELKRVPVVYTEVTEGLWLMNRAYSAAKDHLNTDNVLGWALYMAALAMPVVSCDGEYTPTLSEAGFIKLPKDATYSWSEPEGKSFEHLANRCDSLKEEIFRSYYLISQSRTTAATPAAQSGVSKQQDMTASKKILNLYGDTIRQVLQQLYDMLAQARGDDTVEWDARGLEFPEDPPDEVLTTIEQAKGLGIPSPTFDKELDKMAVSEVMQDASPELLQRMHDEIEKAPDKATRDLNTLVGQATAMNKVAPPIGGVGKPFIPKAGA